MMKQMAENFKYVTQFQVSENTIILWNHRTVIHGDLSLAKKKKTKIKLKQCKLQIANRHDTFDAFDALSQLQDLDEVSAEQVASEWKAGNDFFEQVICRDTQVAKGDKVYKTIQLKIATGPD